MSTKIVGPSASSATQTSPNEIDLIDDNTAASILPLTDAVSTSTFTTPTSSSIVASTCATPTSDMTKPSPELSVRDCTTAVSTSLSGADVVSYSTTPSEPSSSASASCTSYTSWECSGSKELTVHDDAQVLLTKPESSSNDTGPVVTLTSNSTKEDIENDVNINITDIEIREQQNATPIATAQLAENGLHIFDSESDKDSSDGETEQKRNVFSDESKYDIPTSSIKEVKPKNYKRSCRDGLQFFDSDSDLETSDDDGYSEEDSEPDSDVGTDVSKCELRSLDLPKTSSPKNNDDPIRTTLTYGGQSFALYGVADEEEQSLSNDTVANDDNAAFSNRPALPECDRGPRRQYISYNGRESLYTIHEETELDVKSVSDRESHDTGPKIDDDSDSDVEDLDNERTPHNVMQVDVQNAYLSSISFKGLTKDSCFRYQRRRIITARRCGLNLSKDNNSSKSDRLAFDRVGSIARPAVIDTSSSNDHSYRSSNQDPTPGTSSASPDKTRGIKRDRDTVDNDEPVTGTSNDTTQRCKRNRTSSQINIDPDILGQSDPRPISDGQIAGTSTRSRIQELNIAANVATNQSSASRVDDIAQVAGTSTGLSTPEGPNRLSVAGHHSASTETQPCNNIQIPCSSSCTVNGTTQQGHGRNPTLNERKRKRRAESCTYDGETLLKMIKREMDGQDN